ncbi:Scr1 family TA system antitoxin-like transcriptional regulator [Actinoallomurus purpureus]|nr:Scr1 family TA system antitoxin-like transcriptional regulator [Actinoallomurus purpureus]
MEILMLDIGAHAAAACSFELLEFPERVDPDVVYVENVTGSLYVEDESDVFRYSLAFDHLRAKALDPDDTAKLARTVIRDL